MKPGLWRMALVSSLCLLGLGVAACTTADKVPNLTPFNDSAALSDCQDRSLGDRLQLHHQALFEESGGNQLFFQSITLIGAGGQQVRSVVLSPEAVVLFDGEVSKESRQVYKALGPFAEPSLTKTLLDDVALVYLPPQAVVAVGKNSDGCRVCRYRLESQTTEDFLVCPQLAPVLRQYDDHGHLLREVRFSTENAQIPGESDVGVPRAFTLQAFGHIRYNIKFDLIDVQCLP